MCCHRDGYILPSFHLHASVLHSLGRVNAMLTPLMLLLQCNSQPGHNRIQPTNEPYEGYE